MRVQIPNDTSVHIFNKIVAQRYRVGWLIFFILLFFIFDFFYFLDMDLCGWVIARPDPKNLFWGRSRHGQLLKIVFLSTRNRNGYCTRF